MIGRDASLRALEQAAERVAMTHRSHIALVTGPAGIGKSLLLETFLQTSGALALVGRTDPVDRGVPFGLFRDALLRLQKSDELDQTGNEQVEECLTILDATSWTTTAPSAPARINTIFAAVRGVLGAIARSTEQSPVVVAFEDLHDADAESIALFFRLARHVVGVPVLTIATARPDAYGGQNIRPFVERLSSDDRATIIELAPLTREEIGEISTSELGSAASPELTDEVFDGSGGNPFFAKAAISALISEGAVAAGPQGLVSTRTGDPVEAPVDLIDRFFTEGDDDWQAASALALLGRFSLSDLALVTRVAGMDRRRVVECFDRLVAKGLLVSTSAGEYGFAHALLRSALYNRIGSARAAYLHGVAAAAMAEQREQRSQFDVFAYATHVYRSVAPDDPSLVESALEAATRATGTAPLIAGEWFARAAEALEQDRFKLTMVRAQQTMALLTGYASVRAAQVGTQALAEAPEGFPRSGLALATATAAHSSDRLDESLTLLDRELSRNPDDLALSACRMLVLSQMGRAAEAATAYATLAPRAKAAEPGDAFIDAWTFSTMWAYSEQAGMPEDREVFGQLTRTHAARLPGPAEAGMLLYLNTQIGANKGSFQTAERELARAAALLGRSTNPFAGDDVRVDVPTFGWFRGYWDETLESVRTNLALSMDGSNKTAGDVARSVGVIILTDRGDYATAAEFAAELTMGSELGRSLAAIALARVARSRGNLSAALELLESRHHELVERGNARMFTLVTEELAIMQLSRGDHRGAQQTAANAWESIGRAKSRILELWGLRTFATAYEDADAAQNAAIIAEEEGLPFELAKCRLALGELGVQVEDNLRQAIATFDALGAKPWRRRAGSALRAQGLAVPRTARRSANLNNTEQEILGLLQQRLTNRQIAGVLRYSEKTIEAYLSRIYAKTETASRLELVQAIHAGRVQMNAGP